MPRFTTPLNVYNPETGHRFQIMPRIVGRVRKVKSITYTDADVTIFMTTLAALAFLRKNKPGNRIIYHYGNLAFDRAPPRRDAGEVRTNSLAAIEIDKVAKIMMKAHEYGLVELVQVKLANDEVFKVYVAVRTEKPFNGENHVFSIDPQPTEVPAVIQSAEPGYIG